MIPFVFRAEITKELAKSLLTLSVIGLKVVSNAVPFDQGLSDLTTRPSPPTDHCPDLGQ